MKIPIKIVRTYRVNDWNLSVLIPSKIVKTLGLKNGDKMLVYLENNKVVFVPLKNIVS